ncbi:hypothetical protein GCM10023235_67570 [Kitasatospora terrestris]|uniref:Uncharacterized protein n=1 Tax=Kitasatospora terrestris TaxID=258051 RepID=A0ABP9EGU3_9ACTN
MRMRRYRAWKRGSWCSGRTWGGVQCDAVVETGRHGDVEVLDRQVRLPADEGQAGEGAVARGGEPVGVRAECGGERYDLLDARGGGGALAAGGTVGQQRDQQFVVAAGQRVDGGAGHGSPRAPDGPVSGLDVSSVWSRWR